MQMNRQLADILLSAYAPCPAFSGACSSCMRWIPADGYIPTGCVGATGRLEEVELVLVSAEPGDPFPNQTYDRGSAREWLEAASSFAYDNLKHDSDRFCGNIRFILDSCFPGISFDDQMRRTWITDSVLCSAPREGGYVPAAVTRECRARYLEKQLALLPSAIVVALGRKAQKRMRSMPGVVAAYSAAPSGCYLAAARPSWAEIARLVRTRGVCQLPSNSLD